MRIIAGYELTGFIRLQHNIRARALELDEDYAPCSKKFILGPFSKFFEGEQRRKKKLMPRLQSNDCENFAFRAMCDAQDLHDDTYPGRSGVAFGVLL
jgi:hypothetical protein